MTSLFLSKLNESDFASSSSLDLLKGQKQKLSGLGSRGTKLALIFDDGYQSNLTVAAKVLAEYGFAATVAIESDRIGQDYAGDPVLPVLTAANMRSLITDYGWEICNHPALNLSASELEMANSASAENELIVDLLTGAKVLSGSVFVSGSVTNPEFADYSVQGAVYRGGSRNATSDSAYYSIYDKVRSINGSVAFSGDHVHTTDIDSKFHQHWTAYPADTNNDEEVYQTLLSFVETLGSTGNLGVIYAHDTPTSSAGSPSTIIPTPPYIHEAHLRGICKAAQDNGVQIVPWRALGKANLFHDNRLNSTSSVSFFTGSGDTADFYTGSTLNNAPRAIELTATSPRGNPTTTSFASRNFQVRPFTRYRIKVRYKIDTDLTRFGGVGNINHGLAMTLTTYQSNTSGDTGGKIDDYDDAAGRGVSYSRPYLATSGWDTWERTLYTGYGTTAALIIGLFQCTGTVYIGGISIEKEESLIRSPLGASANFNTSLGTNVYFMTPPTSPSSIFSWEFRLLVPAVEFDAGSDTTVDYAFSDSSLISPSSGSTVYVVGEGKNMFTGSGGKIGTWNGSSYSFASVSNGTFIKANNGQGIAPQYYVHRYANSEEGVYIPLGIVGVYRDTPIVTKVNDSFFKVFNASGLRSGSFQWIARPIWER